MGDGLFDIARGRTVELYNRVNNNDPATSAIVLVLIKLAGLEADSVLRKHYTLSALLAAANDECGFTNYVRKAITDTTLDVIAPDPVEPFIVGHLPNQTISSAGGASNNDIGKLLVCYDPDTTGGDDTTIVPVTYHDFLYTTTGDDLVIRGSADGFYKSFQLT